MSSDDKRQRLLRKLAKLKSLAECPTGNPNEAAAAAASMQRLMLEYQIEMAELEGVNDASTIEIVRQPLRPGAAPECAPNRMRHLFSGLSEANQCVGILFREVHGSPKVSLWLLGTEADIENVRTIFDWVTLEVQRLADEWKAVRWWAGVAEANSFKSGAAMNLNRPQGALT